MEKIYCEKLDLTKGSYAYNHNVTLVYISKRDAYVLIDYQLADAVEQLNELGLTTNACCSGHGNDDLYEYEEEIESNDNTVKRIKPDGSELMKDVNGDIIVSVYP